jgi:Flp pilus assembly pilin Flp
MKTLLQRFAADRSGATALEYALLLALVCLVPMVALGSGGEAVAALIGQATSEIAAAGKIGAMQILPPDAPNNLRP